MVDFKNISEKIERQRLYIPILEKYSIANDLSKQIAAIIENELLEKEFDTVFVLSVYEKNVVLRLFSEYSKIDFSLEDYTYDNYDYLMSSGLINQIKAVTGGDFDELRRICDEVSGIKDIHVVNTLTSVLGKTPDAETFKNIKDIINNEISSEKLSILKYLIDFNDPQMKDIINKINNTAAKEVMKKE